MVVASGTTAQEERIAQASRQRQLTEGLRAPGTKPISVQFDKACTTAVPGLICSAGRGDSMSDILVVSFNCVYDYANLLKSDVLGRKTDAAGHC